MPCNHSLSSGPTACNRRLRSGSACPRGLFLNIIVESIAPVESLHLHSACETRDKPIAPSYAGAEGFNNPIMLPSGSAIQANVPAGMGIGPTSFLQPSDSAFEMCAATSSTCT